MVATAGNLASYPAKSARRERTSFFASATIGADGAVASQDVDDPGMGFTKESGDGEYTLAFPVAPRGFIRNISIVSADGTVLGVRVKAFSPTTGTLNFVAQGVDTDVPADVNPASGDVVMVELALDCRYP